MGGVTPGEYSGLFYYTPIIQRAWYVVQVTNMLLGGQSLGLSAATFANNANNGPANAIVDSGTTLMIVPPAAYNALLTSLNNNAAFNNAFGQGAAAQLAQGRCILLGNEALDGGMDRPSQGGGSGGDPSSLAVGITVTVLFLLCVVLRVLFF